MRCAIHHGYKVLPLKSITTMILLPGYSDYSKNNGILLLQGLNPAAPGTTWIYLANLENEDPENATMFTLFFGTVAAQEKSDGECWFV